MAVTPAGDKDARVLRDYLLKLDIGSRATVIGQLSDEEAVALLYDWQLWARPDQLPPAGDWTTWVLQAGRGAGKTRSGAEWLRSRKEAGYNRFALVGRVPADVRDTMVEGEALALDTLIATPAGWTTIGDLVVGDEVFARDGSVTHVVATSPVWTNRPCYAVTLDGASPIVADARHQWVTSVRREREPRRSRRGESLRTSEEIGRTLTSRGRPDLFEHEILCASPLALPAADLPIPPYTLGAWLGDGDTRGHGTFTCHTDDAQIVDEIRDDGFEVRKQRGRYAWGIRGLRIRLRPAGLGGYKHVPPMYLRASVLQRLALLQGLMDTDGDVSARGQCAFNNTNRELVEATRELALSLGVKPGPIAPHPDKRGHDVVFRVTFTLGYGQPVPFRLARKVARCRRAVRSRGRLVRSVTPVTSVPTRCIQVAHPSGTFLAGRDMVVTHNSGLIAISPPWDRPRYIESQRRVEWPNGAFALIYSDEVPGHLRGPQHDSAWVDEFAKFKHPKETWDMLMFGLRLGNNPQVVVTTTPTAAKPFKNLVKAPGTVVTRASLLDNRAHLPRKFIDQVMVRYAGTRLGRQEIDGEIVEQSDGALWRREQLDALRVGSMEPDSRPAPELSFYRRIVVGVDPSVTANDGSDECGIIAVALGEDNHGYVLADGSGVMVPDAWARVAVQMYREYEADRIVAEVNNGGDMVGLTIRTVDQNVGFEAVRASRGKRTRAEPVSALYEQGRIHHVGYLSGLEDEMATWDPMSNDPKARRSPNRIDALVWAVWVLMIRNTDAFLLAMQQENEERRTAQGPPE